MGRQVCMEGRGMWQKFGENCFILSGSQNCQKKVTSLLFSILPKEKRTFLFMELFGLWGYLQGGGFIYDSQGKDFHNLGSLWVCVVHKNLNVRTKIENVPRSIRGEKSSKDMASSRNLVSTIGAQASPTMGDGTRCPEG